MILPNNMIKYLFSDIFVDYNTNGYYDENEFIGNLNQPEHDAVGSVNWDNVNDLSTINKDDFVSFTLDTVFLGTFNDEPFDDQNTNGTWDEGEWFEDVDGDGEWSTDVSYNVLQYQWKIEIAYEDLQFVINDLYNNEQLDYTDVYGLSLIHI